MQVIHTGPQNLDSNANDFERGHVDTFICKTKDVGEFKRVMVGSILDELRMRTLCGQLMMEFMVVWPCFLLVFYTISA